MTRLPNTDAATIAIYDEKAQDYARLTDADRPDTQLQAFLDGLPPDSHVLDLGCGPGRSALMMAQAGHRVLATDASSRMVAMAAQHPGVAAQQATFNQMPDGPFDGIWANFSLLHATRTDLPRHLADISAALVPGGLFHIGMKIGTGMSRDALGRRYTYVTDDELTGLLADVGLTVVARWTGADDKGLSGEMASWVCLQARKTPTPA